MSTRKSRKELRREKLAQERRRRNLLIGGPVAVLVLALVGFIIFRVTEPDIEGIRFFQNLSRTHETTSTYDTASLPPSGGSHNPNWQNCGIYESPVDNSLAVHSLEHGAVWITYRPDLAAGDVAELQEMVRGQSYLLLTPYSDQTADVVMTAWGTQLVVDGVADERIDEFIDRYRQQGPESAPCSGGVGTPLP